MNTIDKQIAEVENRMDEIRDQLSDLDAEFECCSYGGTELREYESLQEELCELEEKLNELEEQL